MIHLDRNALDASSSPYLLQHKDDPVHWQEWSTDVLAEAKKRNKMIFLSIGYATCHWCHVMARESFRDQKTADILNASFISIKVDREQRPDIDEYFLGEVAKRTGSAGWPMSIVLTPDGAIIFGGTYFPPASGRGMPSFHEVLESAIDWQKKHPGGARPERDPGIVIEHESDILPTVRAPQESAAVILSHEDTENGGFGAVAKFPPHATLLFLMALGGRDKDAATSKMVRRTLDVMAMRGLHDHLQGGFYRYCVDPAWEIPHFEKMLYDQAMHLWTYSTAYQLWGDERYARTAASIIRCLEDTFEEDGLYVAAHDADTEREEGKTYVWTEEELSHVLTHAEFKAFSAAYGISQAGNFEGANHFIRRTFEPLDAIEKKLLALRAKRPQPFTDRKIVTSWNALLGIALFLHGRATDTAASLEKALALSRQLLKRHYRNGKLARSSLGGAVQAQGFLEDYASACVLQTYVYEHTRDAADRTMLESLVAGLSLFRSGKGWMENVEGGDFRPVPAKNFDQPTPSSAALTAYALFRSGAITGDDVPSASVGQPLESDFQNLVALLSDGACHVLHGPEVLPWTTLPAFAMQLPGDAWEDCFGKTCRRFPGKGPLLRSFVNRR